MKISSYAALVCILSMTGLMYACTKPSVVKPADIRDKVTGVYIGPDTTFDDAGVVATGIETLKVAPNKELPRWLWIDSTFYYLAVEADSSIVCGGGEEATAGISFLYRFSADGRKLVHTIWHSDMSDTLQHFTHRGVLTRQ